MADDDENHPPFNFTRRDSYNVNGRILLIAVLCLFFVVVVVIALHVYARCMLRRQARRRRAIRTLTMGVMASQAQSGEAPRSGLAPAVIATLPVFMFKEVAGVDKNASAECSVCLCALEEEEMARILPNCKHMFHVECIDMWLGAHSTCPICRTEAEPQALAAQLQPLDLGVTVEPSAPPSSAQPSAPPLDSPTVQCSDCAADAVAQSAKVGGSSSRLSSFRRMLSRERSGRRVQIQTPDEREERDLERQ